MGAPVVAVYRRAYQDRRLRPVEYLAAARPYVEHLAANTPSGVARPAMMAALIGSELPGALVCDVFGATDAERTTVRRYVFEDIQRRRAEAVARNPALQFEGMTYRQYLQTDWWKRIRQQALANARRACQLCGATTRLQVHHRRYVRWGTETLADLIVLCRDCHARHHDQVADWGRR